MQEDRRRTVRREADREMLARLHTLENGRDTGRRQEDDANAREKRHMRRRVIRHECKVRIVLDVVHSAGVLDTWTKDQYHAKGKLLDLSVDGASVFTREALTIGQRVGLVIALPGGDTLNARGHVRWSKGVDRRDGFASGVQFAELDTNSRRRIGRFLQELDETIGL